MSTEMDRLIRESIELDQYMAQLKEPAETRAAEAPKPMGADERSGNALRPRYLDDIIGQDEARAMLREVIDASLTLGRPLDHVLLIGPSGCGKSTFANAIANEMDADCYQVEAPISHETLLELREVMRDGDLLFIDEALALDTPLPTPTGWTTMGEVQVGDQLLGATGVPTTVTHLTPVNRDAECYRLTFQDGSEIVADAGHLWFASPRVSGGSSYLKPRVVTTQEMIDSGRVWRIPNPAAVELPEADLPMDPYLFGQWLGNGNVGQVYINVRSELAEATLAIARRSYSEAKLLPDAISHGSIRRLGLGKGAGGPWGRKPSAARRDLEALGTFERKALPEVYLRGSIEQRLALVRGLMDSDGHLSRSGYAVFSNTNPSIVAGMTEVLRTLGYMPTVTSAGDARAGARGTHRPCWRVSFRPTPDRNPFLLRNADRVTPRIHGDARRILSIEPTEKVPVRCLGVDAGDHVFLAGQGMIPTHNCHQQASQDRRGVSTSTSPETIYQVLEDRKIISANGVLDYPHITVIGATTDPGRLPIPFQNRFPLRPQLRLYTTEELSLIARMNADKLGIALDDDAAELLAGAARGVPRQVNNYIKNAELLAVARSGRVDMEVAETVLYTLNRTTKDGLDAYMQETLVFLYRFGGRQKSDGSITYQAGVGTIATAIGLSRDQKAVSLFVEPFLIQAGLLQVGHGGRILTEAGIKRAKELI